MTRKGVGLNFDIQTYTGESKELWVESPETEIGVGQDLDVQYILTYPFFSSQG